MTNVVYCAGPDLRSALSGHRLFCHQWMRGGNNTPRALLCLCHGVTEHTQRYRALAENLAECQILVFGNDHVGHGQSEGERVFVDDIDTYIQDVIHLILTMKEKYDAVPCLLYGHSMGGLIAAHVAIQRPELIQGLILSSAPTYPIYNGVLMNLATVAVRLFSIFIPNHPVIPWDPTAVSSQSHEVTEFIQDPLIYHGNIRFSWVKAMVNSMIKLEESLKTIILPVLIIHGSDDSLVPISSSEHIYETISSTDKIIEVFSGNYHEVLHDLGQEQAIILIQQWILNHIVQ